MIGSFVVGAVLGCCVAFLIFGLCSISKRVDEQMEILEYDYSELENE